MAQFYAAHRQPEPQQTLFDMDDDEDFSYEPEDYEDEELTEDAPEMDENDPFYFLGGGCIYESQKELQRSLGNRCIPMNGRSVTVKYKKLRREILRRFFRDSCRRTHGRLSAALSAVLYLSCKELLLGYDMFVKDDPASPEWIFYESLLGAG
ncbi:MAG: hypothetical protein ACLR23_14505 [Clostridia bacterium]